MELNVRTTRRLAKDKHWSENKRIWFIRILQWCPVPSTIHVDILAHVGSLRISTG